MQILPSASANDAVKPQTIRRIVVPLDGTLYAERAMPAAVALARAFNAEVMLVRANPSAHCGDTRRTSSSHQRTRETWLGASLYLARKEQDLRKQGVRVLTSIPFGPAADAIATAATERHADLIVIATHLGTAFSRPSQISVARELLEWGRIPILLLSSATRTPFDRMEGLGLTLLVPLSGAAGCASAIPFATMLAQALAGQLLLLCAVGGPAARALKCTDPALFALGTEPVWAQVIGYLERLRSNLITRDVPVWTGIVEGDLLAETARQAHTWGELIALSLYGSAPQRESGIKAALELLRRAGVPLLVVPQCQRLELLPNPEAMEEPALDEGALI
jgi:nucleotide-binding universal stress UspA family protein